MAVVEIPKESAAHQCNQHTYIICLHSSDGYCVHLFSESYVYFQGRYVGTVELMKGVSGLGFSVLALGTEKKTGLGIFIEEVKPGGVAYR